MVDTLTPSQTLNMVIQDRLEKVKLTGFRTLANFADRGLIREYNDTEENWLADVGGEGASWTGITDVSTTSTQGNTARASLSYGTHRLYHRFDINKVDFAVAAKRGAAPLANLFGSHTDRALLALFRKLNEAIYKADGTAAYGNMIGLERVKDNLVSYAGIDPNVYQMWKVQKNTGAFRTLAVATPAAGTYTLTINGVACSYTFVTGDNEAAVLAGLKAAVNDRFSAAQVDIDVTAKRLLLHSNPGWTVTPAGPTLTVGALVQAKRPFSREAMLKTDQLVSELETMYDMVITTPSVGTGYTQVFDTIAQQYAVTHKETNQLRSVDLGHSGRLYNGYQMVEDPMATAGNIYLIDSQSVRLDFFRLDNMTSMGYATHEVNESYGIPIHIFETAPTIPTVRTFEFFVIPQLKVYNRRAITVIENLH